MWEEQMRKDNNTKKIILPSLKYSLTKLQSDMYPNEHIYITNQIGINVVRGCGNRHRSPNTSGIPFSGHTVGLHFPATSEIIHGHLTCLHSCHFGRYVVISHYSFDLLTALLKFTYYKNQELKAYSSMVLNILKELCNHHHNSHFSTFSSSQNKTL